MKIKKKHIKVVLKLLFLWFFVWYLNCIPDVLFNDPVSLVLIDKNEKLFGAHVALDEQWRFPETKEVNDKFCKALVAYEDKRFYSHIGVDFLALSRAVKSNFSKNRIVSGASTLTMQTVRLSRKNPKRTYFEKIAEIFRATRLEIRYSKNKILGLYASHAPFGGNVVGINAAAWKYFGKNQNKLNWSEATMLAVLPNAPSLIHPGKNRGTLLKKRNKLLDKLFETNQIDSITCYLSKLEPLPQKPLNIPNHTPHLLDYFLKKGKQNYVHTSIDFQLQNQISDILQNQSNRLQSIAVNNASALVIETKTGKVVSYIGNVNDKQNRYENRVDMITAKRSTGSILKPILYAAMLDEGLILPKSLIQDIPTSYYGYSPKNYNLSTDGVVPADEVISRSLNIPSVNMLNKYGVSTFLLKLKSYGITSINKSSNHYGLPLILGGAEVSPWELGKIYTAMSQKLMGVNHSVSLLQNDTSANSLQYNYPNKSATWHMMDAMLNVKRPSENMAWKAFENTNKIAWKTGTSFGGRDAWAVGCSPNYTVVVWAGNTDGEGRPNLTGIHSAAPILFNIYNILQTNNDWFDYPTEQSVKIKICSKSGHKANANCIKTETQNVPAKGKDSKPCNYCKLILLDSTEKFQIKGSDYPLMDAKEKVFFILNPTEAIYYKKNHADYVALPPFLKKQSDVTLTYPKNKAKIYLPKLNDSIRSNMIVKATTEEENDQLFWTLDNDFIGTTIQTHQLTIKPTKGNHKLTVVNSSGKRLQVSFEVVE